MHEFLIIESERTTGRMRPTFIPLKTVNDVMNYIKKIWCDKQNVDVYFRQLPERQNQLEKYIGGKQNDGIYSY